MNPDSKEGVHLACNITTQADVCADYQSPEPRFTAQAPRPWRTMIASLSWNVTLPLTLPVKFSAQAPPSLLQQQELEHQPKRRSRSESLKVILYFILLLRLPVRMHGWISKFKSTTAAMIVIAARTARSAVAAEIEAAQTLAQKSPKWSPPWPFGRSAASPSFPSLQPLGESHTPSTSHFVPAHSNFKFPPLDP